MHRVTPKVFLVGETILNSTGMEAYLRHIDTKWRPDMSDGKASDSELLTEFYGRLCYRSFEAGMNKNVSKIREGNDVYLANIIKSKHGSVLEHCVANFVIADCSRVFTHELVRHRVGTAFSQESLRYVRLEDLGLWLPPEVDADPKLRAIFEKMFDDAGKLQVELAHVLNLDAMNFEDKKKWTSTMRRLAPHGLATTIGLSVNFRALRHLIEMRTSGGAEVEIRIIVDQIAEIAMKRWPNFFGDFKRVDGGWVPTYSKV